MSQITLLTINNQSPVNCSRIVGVFASVVWGSSFKIPLENQLNSLRFCACPQYFQEGYFKLQHSHSVPHNFQLFVPSFIILSPNDLKLASINQFIYPYMHRYTKLSSLNIYDHHVQSFAIQSLIFPFSYSVFFLFRWSFIYLTP